MREAPWKPSINYLYFSKMDKERHTIDKLYLDTATLAWNGNPVDGINSIKVIQGNIYSSNQNCPIFEMSHLWNVHWLSMEYLDSWNSDMSDTFFLLSSHNFFEIINLILLYFFFRADATPLKSKPVLG